MTSDVVTSKHVQWSRGLWKLKHRHQCLASIYCPACNKKRSIYILVQCKQSINGHQIPVLHLQLKNKLVYCGGSELFRNMSVTLSLYKENKEATFETIQNDIEWLELRPINYPSVYNLDVAKFASFQFNGGNTALYKHIILTARGVLPFVDYDLFKW